jgi:catechol 2,3-dioxygenase-like lactoylglutathione lyase family enzyme
MKRFHVHVGVDDLAANIRFYTTVFGIPPTVEKSDYAKWMIDDPRINFAISQRGLKAGIDHLGLQVETDDELEQMRGQVGQAEIAVLDQIDASCCYAKSDKYWVTDPQGIAWETFRTLDSIPVYGNTVREQPAQTAPCCGPAPAVALPAAKSGTCC